MKHTALLTLLGLGVLVACGGESPPASALSAQDLEGGPFDEAPAILDRSGAESRASSFFGGTVVSSKLDVERGLSVFEIDVLLASGAVIEIALEEATGRVVQIESKVGPFDDELELGAGFVSLQDAIAAAREVRSGAIVEWELEMDGALRWVFEIELENDVKVKVDARTGEIVDDDHGDDPWDDDGDDGAHAEAPESVKQTALGIVDGTIVKSERELEHGMNAWKLTVRTLFGAEAEIYLLQDGAGLLRVRDDAGPFDYAVEPGRGWLTLSEAVDAAGGTMETLDRYRLDREGGTFRYELEFSDTEIDVDASTGTRLD